MVYINNKRVQLTSNELIQLLESAPANSIKSVEVITNPPASYDADSGSVINIIMSKNLVTGYRGSVLQIIHKVCFQDIMQGQATILRTIKLMSMSIIVIPIRKLTEIMMMW